jgi:probable rRNA maturation factor
MAPAVQIHYMDIEPLSLHAQMLETWFKRICIEESFILSRITLHFCSDEELLRMNNEHLQHDFYTDIITFDYSKHPIIKGELYISVDRVKENAEQLQITSVQELHRMMAHGLLHLMGYGDKSKEESAVMREKEDWALSLR